MKKKFIIISALLLIVPLYLLLNNNTFNKKEISDKIANMIFNDGDNDYLGEIPVAENNNSTSSTDSLFCQELLGKPTTNSITINACSHPSYDIYYEYGLDSINYTNQTSVITSIDSIPFNVTITGLNPNTKYYYRMKYRLSGGSSYTSRASHSFQTARPSGSSFTFAIQADPHCDTNTNFAVYALTLANMKLKNPDFLIDMGDTFMSEKLTTFNPLNVRYRMLLLRSYYDKLCNSVPLYLVIGNHEGELGWQRDTTANCMPVITANARNKYYINPEPNSFYSGDTSNTPYVGLRRSYYSWTWGNCLFVVIDPYWNTLSKPGWGWTLGRTQFDWFKNVLSTSTAKFKFVFCHQVVGGYGNDGRGGSEAAKFYEQGGYNSDSTWGFDANRPGWGGKSIHQLMVLYRVNIYFHGHDHFFGYQTKDNVIYQELPQPSARNYNQMSDSLYGYVSGVHIPSRGYMSVTVNNTSAKFEYIRTYLPTEEGTGRHNLDVSYSYTIDTSGNVAGVNSNNININNYALFQNYPNPFNPLTKIQYFIPKSGFVKLVIYDLLGREIETLVNGKQQEGIYEKKWDASGYPSGIYFYKLIADNYVETKKMVLLK